MPEPKYGTSPLMKKNLVIFLVFFVLHMRVDAQYTLGSTGLFNIPTADMAETGTFRTGINFLPEEITPRVFSYNTGNYFFNLTYFSFVEFTFRGTLLKSTFMSTKPKYQEQDRSYSIRFRLLKEGAKRPGLAIGFNDPVADTGTNYFQSAYGVLTKGLALGAGGGYLSSSLGYYIPRGISEKPNRKYGNNYDGLFVGISYSPPFCREMKTIAEYDSHGFNVGLAARLWKHLSLHGFTHDFQSVSAGVRYECTLKH